MPNFTAGTSFTDGVTNDVTAAKLNALVADAVPTSSLSLNSTTGTIANFTSSTANITLGTIPTLTSSTANITLGTIPTLTSGTTTGTAATFTSGTITTGVIPTLTSGTTTGTAATFTSGTITTGVIPTLTAGTTIGTSATFTSGTITTGVIPTLTSTTLITSGTGTAAAPAIVPTGDTNTGIFFPAADTIAFSEGGAESMRIDSSGNVGVGATSLSKKLTVYSDNSTAYSSSDFDSARNLLVQNANTTTNANVGVQFLVGTNSEAAITAIRTGDGTADLAFGTRGGGSRAERLRIDSSGNVLVGTTDYGLSTGVGFKIQYANGSTLPRVGVVINATGDSNYHLYNTNATYNGYRFYVSTNGGIANYSANNSNLSDARLKTDIVNAGDYLEKICSIPVRTFKYKDQGEDNEKTVGIIAQEVEQIIPELINNDGFGETPSDGIPYKTIYQTDFQYVLMRCIQELKSENDNLKIRITALESA